jgi:hypothetical protein
MAESELACMPFLTTKNCLTHFLASRGEETINNYSYIASTHRQSESRPARAAQPAAATTAMHLYLVARGREL